MAYDNLVLLSGGPDSVVCLAMAHGEFGVDTAGIFFDYGQRNYDRERLAVERIVSYYQVPIFRATITGVFNNDSALLEGSEQALVGDPNILTRSPAEVYFRNGVFAACAASRAASIGASRVWLGTHLRRSGNGSLYSDSTEEFLTAMAAAVQNGTGDSVGLYAPFADGTKKDIIHEGDILSVPWHLTWSCYRNSAIACGECFACHDRAQAFADAGVTDTAILRD